VNGQDMAQGSPAAGAADALARGWAPFHLRGRAARAPEPGIPQRRVPAEDIVPVGRDREPPPSGDQQGQAIEIKRGRKPLGRRTRSLALVLAVEVALSGVYFAAIHHQKTRGVSVPVTETDRTRIT
jgi:hypothetical protein